MLDAIADALRLNAVERGHLRVLARPARRHTPSPRIGVRPELGRMLDLMDTVPALIITDTFTVLAANALARKLFEPLGDYYDNMALALFAGWAARAFYVEWDEVAAATVAQLRLVAGRHPMDQEVRTLIDDLTAASPEFADLWRTGDVAQRGHGSKSFRHPELGVLTMSYENLELPGDPRQRLVTFTPAAALPVSPNGSDGYDSVAKGPCVDR